MKSITIKPIALLSVVSIFFGSCANMSDADATKAQGAGLGALAGGIAGAIIGNQFGGNAEKGAMWGAAIGGASGFAYGTHVANQKAKYASTELWLDACIVSAENKRSAAVAYNNSLDNRIAQLKREIKMAKASNDRAKLATLKNQISYEESNVNKQISGMNSEIASQQQAIGQSGSSSRASQLRAKLNTLGSVNKTTEQRKQVLAQLRNSTGV
jgi:hypothetical protein